MRADKGFFINFKEGVIMKIIANKKEEKIMKRILITLFVAALSVLLIHGYADAKVSGTCSACHTMHNSQDGTAANFDGDDTPNSKLLKGGCVGCHAQNTADNVVDSVIPQVWHSNATDLAGGNFAGVVTADANGHNVSDVVSADATHTNTPPGYNSSYDPASTDFDTTSRLVCAGQNGCHGNRDESDEFTAVSGAHHGDDSILHYGSDFTFTGQGADITTSYRMLYKIKGAEDPDWQKTNSSTDHNGYYGVVYADRTTQSTWSGMTGTISELCSECHGAFHASPLSGDVGIGDGSPWERHPTDVVIPNSGEYASINTTYQDETPVGRPAAFFTNALAADAAKNGTVAAGTDIVICLSCHRAHATDYADALRFDYTNTLGSGEGCLHCHTNKDAF